MEDDKISELIVNAFEARTRSYCPYSGYAVGAALLTGSGDIYRGCNVENSSYGATICAERCAALKAVSEGERVFKAIAIAGAPRDASEVRDYAYPCGVCRQVMREFCDTDFKLYLGGKDDTYVVKTLGEMLPLSFSNADMN